MRRLRYEVALGMALVLVVVAVVTMVTASFHLASGWDMLFGVLCPAVTWVLGLFAAIHLWWGINSAWRLCIAAAVFTIPAILDGFSLAIRAPVSATVIQPTMAGWLNTTHTLAVATAMQVLVFAILVGAVMVRGSESMGRHRVGIEPAQDNGPAAWRQV